MKQNHSAKDLQEVLDILPVREIKDLDVYPYDMDVLEEDFKKIIIDRINFCSIDLLAATNATVNKERDIAIYDGGHFSMEVYRRLEEALNTSCHEWNQLVWQQILRQLYEEAGVRNYNLQHSAETLFRYASAYIYDCPR